MWSTEQQIDNFGLLIAIFCCKSLHSHHGIQLDYVPSYPSLFALSPSIQNSSLCHYSSLTETALTKWITCNSVTLNIIKYQGLLDQLFHGPNWNIQHDVILGRKISRKTYTTEMEGAGVYRSCIKEGIHLKREKLFRLILTHYSVTG